MSSSPKPALPFDFEPGPWSVICGKGKQCFNHVGNKRFRFLVSIYHDSYENARNRTEKSFIVMSIVDSVRDASPIGGFVRFDNKTRRWVEVADGVAREKVGQQFRENATKKNHEKSNRKKLQRREQRLQRMLRRNASLRSKKERKRGIARNSSDSAAFLGSKMPFSRPLNTPFHQSIDEPSNTSRHGEDIVMSRNGRSWWQSQAIDFFDIEWEFCSSEVSLSDAEYKEEPHQAELSRQESPQGFLDLFPFPALPKPEVTEILPPKELTRQESLVPPQESLDSNFLLDPLAAPPLLSSESLTLITKNKLSS